MDQYKIWDGACPIPICFATSPVDLELVGIDGNHLSSTREGLLGSTDLRFHVTLCDIRSNLDGPVVALECCAHMFSTTLLVE